MSLKAHTSPRGPMPTAHYTAPGLPPAQGLYDPAREHDACGVGFIAHIKNKKTHDIVRQGLQILVNLDHRGARRSPAVQASTARWRPRG